MSIIILCYNAPDYERKCIESVLRHTTVPYELILVNNNGTPESKAVCKEYSTRSGIIYVELLENKSVANGWNRGISYTNKNYPYIAILNNDLILTKDWDKLLLAPLQKDAKVAMTGPTLSYCATSQRDPIAYRDRQKMKVQDIDAFAEKYAHLYLGKEYPMRDLSGCCFILSRESLNAVGLFDEEFLIGSGEEAEWEFRARKKGYTLVWVQSCYVHHYGHVSFSERERLEPSLKSEAVWRKNAELYQKKIKEAKNNGM